MTTTANAEAVFSIHAAVADYACARLTAGQLGLHATVVAAHDGKALTQCVLDRDRACIREGADWVARVVYFDEGDQCFSSLTTSYWRGARGEIKASAIRQRYAKTSTSRGRFTQTRYDVVAIKDDPFRVEAAKLLA